jgi:hypothetical protein
MQGFGVYAAAGPQDGEVRACQAVGKVSVGMHIASHEVGRASSGKAMSSHRTGCPTRMSLASRRKATLTTDVGDSFRDMHQVNRGVSEKPFVNQNPVGSAEASSSDLPFLQSRRPGRDFRQVGKEQRETMLVAFSLSMSCYLENGCLEAEIRRGRRKKGEEKVPWRHRLPAWMS